MSHTLESTNTRLTGNIKTVFDGTDIFLESINSTDVLSSNTYKKIKFNYDTNYKLNLKQYLNRGSIKDYLYNVKNDNSDILSVDLSEQYPQLYRWGCYSTTSDNYDKNLRFFAPIELTFDKVDGVEKLNDVPTHFVIYRITEPHENIYDVIKKGNIVKLFDLSKIKSNIFDRLENCGLTLHFENEIGVKGYDVDSGYYIHKNEWGFNNLCTNETTITEFENWITNTYQRNGSLYTNIQNLEFIFDDEFDGFCNYVGFYIKTKEINVSDNTNYSKDEVIKLIRLSDDNVDVYDNQTLGKYDRIVDNSICRVMGKESYRYIDINVRINPNPNELLQINLNGEVIYTLQLTNDLIGDSVQETVNNIVNQITVNYDGVGLSISARKLAQNKFRIYTNGIVYDEELTFFSTSKSIYADKQLYSNKPSQNDFIGYDKKSVVLTKYVPYIESNKIKINGVIAQINKIQAYEGNFIYHTDVEFSESTNDVYVEHIKEINQKILIGELFNHTKLDTLNNITNYADVLDFDIDLYKNYLLNEVNKSTYVGSIVTYYGKSIENITESEKQAYKNLIVNNINNYFNTVYLHREYLINNVDATSGESTNVSNEYDRLNERTHPSIVGVNKMYQFITKWVLDGAVDSYHNPYRLSVGLPLRPDNFSTSHQNENRYLPDHTLSWFVIGEGVPPYLELSDNTINKFLSYSTTPVDIDSLKNKETNWFDSYFTYSTPTQIKNSFSILKKNFGQDGVSTFFKGVNYQIEDETLDGYKFIVLLKSDATKADVDLSSEIIRNDTFKTYTLVVYYYIPDPILTSLEGGIPYFLDRSLFYFSKEIYSTQATNYNFGVSRISLNMFDDQITKQYGARTVGKKWLNDIQTGVGNETEKLIWVGRGDASVFSTDFRSVFQLGKDYVIEYNTNYDVEDSPYYGIEITYKNIKFVGVDYFWCTDVIIKGNYNGEFDENAEDDQDISNNVVREWYEISVIDENGFYVYEQTELYEKKYNVFVVSRAVAMELAKHYKIVTNNVNNERYKKLTISLFKDYLKRSFKTKNIDGVEIPLINVVSPKYFNIGVTLTGSTNESNPIERLTTPYFYSMFRMGGLYKPKTVTLLNIDTNYLGEKIYPMVETPYYDYRKNIARSLGNSYLDKMPIKEYNKQMFTHPSNTKFEYFITHNNNIGTYEQIDFKQNPTELRNFSSIVFNSYKTLRFEGYSVGSTVYLYKLMANKVNLWLNSLISESDIDNEINEIVKNFDSQGNRQLNNSTNRDNTEVIKVFIRTFLKSYYVDRIYDSDGNNYEYMMNDTDLIIRDLDENTNKKLFIIFKK